MNAFHPEVMPDTQRQILLRFGPIVSKAGFFLAGGTAIAIQLGHRRSIDLDWFTDAEIADGLHLAAALRCAGADLAVTDVARGTLHGEAGGVKMSFLEYRYPALLPPLDWPEYGCHLAALEDLACMKLSAIGSRGAKKDFIDLYALGQTRFTLEGMLDLYQRKFVVDDLGHTLMSMTFFDDAEEEGMPVMLWNVEWKEIKRTIERWVSDYVRQTGARLGR